MRFEDEQYVRLYRRDTTSWLMLPWQARCVLPLILRACDRAGIIDLGEDGWEGLAVTIKVPADLVEAAMPAILRRGILVLQDGGLLVWPKFIEAQEAKQSDRARQKAARDRARDLALARARGVDVDTTDGAPASGGPPSSTTFLASPDVTPRDGVVTPRDTSSREPPVSHENVTLSCEVNSCEMNKQTSVPPTSDSSESVPIPPEEITTTRLKIPETVPLLLQPEPLKDPDPAEVIFGHWVAGWKRNVKGTRAPLLDAKRRSKIRARLKEKFSVEDIKQAIDGLWASEWHVEKRHYDIELVCRDAAHVEKFMAEAPKRWVAAAEPLDPPPEIEVTDEEADAALEEALRHLRDAGTTETLREIERDTGWKEQ